MYRWILAISILLAFCLLVIGLTADGHLGRRNESLGDWVEELAQDVSGPQAVSLWRMIEDLRRLAVWPLLIGSMIFLGLKRRFAEPTNNLRQNPPSRVLNLVTQRQLKVQVLAP